MRTDHPVEANLRGGLLDISVRRAVSWFLILGGYIAGAITLVTSLLKLSKPLQEFLPEGFKWLWFPLSCAPLVAAIMLHGVPTTIAKIRKRRTIRTDTENLKLFRLTPRGPEDQPSFTRKDGVHNDALHLIESTDSRAIFVTGRSGSGKSSLFRAWVVPKLSSDTLKTVIFARSFEDPVLSISREIAKQPSAAELTDTSSVEGTATWLGSQKSCILIVDQFEEHLLALDKDPLLAERFKQFLQLISTRPSIVLVLSLRSEYTGMLHVAYQSQKLLPPLRQEETWISVGSFTETEARDFLKSGGIELAKDLEDIILRQLSEVEDASGLFRPITLNMAGMILKKTSSTATVNAWGKGLIYEYLVSSIGSTESAAAAVLKCLINNEARRLPRSISDIRTKSNLPEAEIVGRLNDLSLQGLVRSVDEQNQWWEISHDFVALQLVRIFASGLARGVKRFFAPAMLVALALWAGFAFAVFRADARHPRDMSSEITFEYCLSSHGVEKSVGKPIGSFGDLTVNAAVSGKAFTLSSSVTNPKLLIHRQAEAPGAIATEAYSCESFRSDQLLEWHGERLVITSAKLVFPGVELDAWWGDVKSYWDPGLGSPRERDLLDDLVKFLATTHLRPLEAGVAQRTVLPVLVTAKFFLKGSSTVTLSGYLVQEKVGEDDSPRLYAELAEVKNGFTATALPVITVQSH